MYIMKVHLTKANIIGIVSGAVSFCLAFFITSKMVTKCTSNGKDNLSFMTELCKEASHNPSIMIDQETRLDSVCIIDGKSFCYNYTLINLSKDDLDCNSIASNVDPIVRNNALTMKGTEIFRKRAIPLTYRYFDKNGELVHSIYVSETEYKE